MAGAGYKLFNTGDVLTAQQVNEYLMQQTVMVFASAAARTTALSGVLAEGMVSYLQDTNVVEIYTGASWVSLDDPNAIQNSLLTTTGDTIYASGASTPARLGIGTTGQVLTVSGGVPTWATPSGGALTQLATGNLSGLSSVNITSISQSYKNLVLLLRSVQHINGEETRMRLNNVSTALYARTIMVTSAATLSQSSGQSYWFLQDTTGQGANDSAQVITINNYTNGGHPTTFASWDGNSSGRGCFGVFGASQTGLNGSITQINLFLNSGTWAAGNYTLFGEN